MQDKDQKLIWEKYSLKIEGIEDDFMDFADENPGRNDRPKDTSLKLRRPPQEDIKFDLPYTNGRGGAPRPEMIEHDNSTGSFYIQQFGPEPAAKPLQYPNHNPLGGKLDPGELFEVHINWEWYGEYEPDSFTTPGTEPQTDNPQIERILDEDGRDVPESHPVWKHATKIVDEHFYDAGESTMRMYGWAPEDDY